MQLVHLLHLLVCCPLHPILAYAPALHVTPALRLSRAEKRFISLSDVAACRVHMLTVSNRVSDHMLAAGAASISQLARSPSVGPKQWRTASALRLACCRLHPTLSSLEVPSCWWGLLVGQWGCGKQAASYSHTMSAHITFPASHRCGRSLHCIYTVCTLYHVLYILQYADMPGQRSGCCRFGASAHVTALVRLIMSCLLQMHAHHVSGRLYDRCMRHSSAHVVMCTAQVAAVGFSQAGSHVLAFSRISSAGLLAHAFHLLAGPSGQPHSLPPGYGACVLHAN